MVTKDIYDELADMLLSEGHRVSPEMKTTELIEILQLQYTPDEARLALKIGFLGGKLDELVEKTGMKKAALAKTLRTMAHKGTVWIDPTGDTPTYKALMLEAPGLEETVGWSKHEYPWLPELRKRFHNYNRTYYTESIVKKGPAPLGPYAASKALPPDATPEENIIDVVKKEVDYWAVSNCGCRVFEEAALGYRKCQHPKETCMSFGETGRWAVKNGFAREITCDEAIKILLKAEEAGLIHYGIPQFGQMCNCCKDVCLNLLGLQMGLPHIMGPNPFVAVCDEKACTACTICVDRCNVDAINIDEFAVVDVNKCLGCGVCVVGCDQGALKLKRRSEGFGI